MKSILYEAPRPCLSILQQLIVGALMPHRLPLGCSAAPGHNTDQTCYPFLYAGSWRLQYFSILIVTFYWPWNFGSSMSPGAELWWKSSNQPALPFHVSKKSSVISEEKRQNSISQGNLTTIRLPRSRALTMTGRPRRVPPPPPPGTWPPSTALWCW